MRVLLVLFLAVLLWGTLFVTADEEYYKICMEKSGKSAPCMEAHLLVKQIHLIVRQLPQKNETLVVERYDFTARHKMWVNETFEVYSYEDFFGDILTSIYLNYKICLKNETLVNETEGWYLNGKLYKERSQCVELTPMLGMYLYDLKKHCEWLSQFVKTVHVGNAREYIIELVLVWKGYKIEEYGDDKIYNVNIKVIGDGKVSPIPGRYIYKGGSVLLLKAEDNLSSGSIFYGWDINGEFHRELMYRVDVRSSINVTAIFKNIRDIAKGSGVDLEMNKDLIADIVHKGWNGSIILGGPAVHNYSWEYKFLREKGYNGLIIKGDKYRIKYGEIDYALVKKDGDVLRVAGVTRYGTRAGLMWAVSHMKELRDGVTYIVLWRDVNGNGLVEERELAKI